MEKEKAILIVSTEIDSSLTNFFKNSGWNVSHFGGKKNKIGNDFKIHQYNLVAVISASEQATTEFIKIIREKIPATPIIIFCETPFPLGIELKKDKNIYKARLPLDPDEINQLIELSSRKKQESKQEFKYAHILIVDDKEENRQLLVDVLATTKWTTTTANNGAEALSLINASKPDLVLLDFMMPDMDGKEVLSWIREKYSKSELPVIIVSAQDDITNVEKLVSLGINDYIIKPIDAESLLEKISSCL